MASSYNRRSGSSGSRQNSGEKQSTPKSTRRIAGSSQPASARNNVDARPTRGRRNTPDLSMEQTSARTPGQRHAQHKRDDRARRARDRALRRVIFFALVFLCVGVLGWGISGLVNASWFTVSHYQVSGLKHLGTQYAVELAAVPKDQSLITVSSKQIKQRMLKSPWVSSVNIKKRLPNTLVLEVVERTPALRVITPTKSTWVIASDGVWLGQLQSGTGIVYKSGDVERGVTVDAKSIMRVTDIPQTSMVVGDTTKSTIVRNALGIYNSMSSGLRKQIESMAAPEIALTKMFTFDHVEISVGSAESMKIKDKIIVSILREQKGKVVLINVRSVEKPTWRGLEKQ